jgi:hypothetical protein
MMMNELTDDELMAAYSCIYDEVHYGDDSVVYAAPGENAYADALRGALAKVTHEAEQRRIV